MLLYNINKEDTV